MPSKAIRTLFYRLKGPSRHGHEYYMAQGEDPAHSYIFCSRCSAYAATRPRLTLTCRRLLKTLICELTILGSQLLLQLKTLICELTILGSQLLLQLLA